MLHIYVPFYELKKYVTKSLSTILLQKAIVRYDADRYAIIVILVDSIFNILVTVTFLRLWEIQTHLHRTFLSQGYLHKL
jgi:hypothetical protein